MKKSLKRWLYKWYVITALVVIIAVALIWALRGNNTPVIESAAAAIGSIRERVSVTGKILPMDKADLAFEKSGLVSKINVNVGGHVRKGSVIAVLDNASDVAALQSAQAKLDDLTRNLTSEEQGLEQTKVVSAGASLTSAINAAMDAARSSYVGARTAVTNNTDMFFTNPQSANPVVSVRTQSMTEQLAIDSERLALTDTFNNWKNDLAQATSSDRVASLLSRSVNYLSTIKVFMSDMAGIINNLNIGNSGLTQNVIDTDVATMNAAQSSLNQAISSVTAAQSALNEALSGYNQAESGYLLRLAGSSKPAIRAQAAMVAGYEAELAKDSLISPIDGILTKSDPKVGEFVAVGQSGFAVQSEGLYKVEAYVPEADIAKVALGNIASTTLDAYGQYVDFPAGVMAIDPAETVIEGVPTYKVTLQFIQTDVRIRSGMTANLEILTHERTNVLTIPTRAVVDSAGAKTVRVLNTDNKTFTSVPVTVGLKGSDGTIEVLSGLSAGQRVVTYVK